MSKIILISCVKKKDRKPRKAKELYTSTLFKYAYKYAEKLNPNKIFILSAKHGLLEPNKIISPYNVTLNNMKEHEKKEWAKKVIQELNKKTSLKKDEFIILAGNNYRKHLLKEIKHYKIPLKSLGLGKQIQYLKRHSQ